MRKNIPELEMERVDELPGFACRLCARCCHDKLIPLYKKDLERLEGLEACIEETASKEAALSGAGYKMKMVGDRCILLKDGRCSHYGLRPDTCRRHPFIVTSKNLLVATTCMGLDWSRREGSEGIRRLSEGISFAIDRYLEDREKRLLKGR
jgi:Fe-S-cluster containining protein